MEALLCGRPTLAIGEAKAIGLITPNNLDEALASNFGDIGPTDLDIDFAALPAQVALGLTQGQCEATVQARIKAEYDLGAVVERLEQVYQDAWVDTHQREIPVLMYHRFIQSEREKGVHGTWLPVAMLEKHLRLLRRQGFESLTFAQLADKGFIHRLQPGKRFVILTVDDGYRDNLRLLLPLLEKYDFRAVIYAVTGEDHNRWDVEAADNPDRPVPLMDTSELRQLIASGRIELGGHTLNHPRLSQLDATEQRHQIQENKTQLEAITGTPLLSFAYPYGDFNAMSKRLVAEAGYRFAVSTNAGPLAMHRDPYAIRRIGIFPRTDSFGLWRKVRGNYLFKKAKKA